MDRETVVKFTGTTVVDESPNDVLEKAKAWGLEHVIIVGADENSKIIWGGSFSDVADINWLLDVAKQELVEHMVDATQGE